MKNPWVETERLLISKDRECILATTHIATGNEEGIWIKKSEADEFFSDCFENFNFSMLKNKECDHIFEIKVSATHINLEDSIICSLCGYEPDGEKE